MIEEIGFQAIQTLEKQIHQKMMQELQKLPQITIYNPQAENIITFNLHKIHAHDVESF